MRKSTRPTPTVEDFKRWLRKQPAKRTFNFFDNENCLLASFMTETDKEGNRWRWTCPGYNAVECGSRSVLLPTVLYQIAVRQKCTFTVSEVRKYLKTTNCI